MPQRYGRKNDEHSDAHRAEDGGAVKARYEGNLCLLDQPGRQFGRGYGGRCP